MEEYQQYYIYYNFFQFAKKINDINLYKSLMTDIEQYKKKNIKTITKYKLLKNYNTLLNSLNFSLIESIKVVN